jgi:hypothetical protein
VLGSGPGTPQVIDPADPRVLDVAVTLNNLEQSQLPITTFARTLQVAGPWTYDATRDEVDGRTPTTAGQQYSMQVYVPTITADDLKTAAVATPPGPDDYLQLPDSQHIGDVSDLARQVVGDAATPYAKAMALQGYLRSTANFTYDTRVPPATTSDAVWDFLQDRRGYCVQFATAMAIMARTLGIPTRVAVGFLPGSAVQEGDHFTYVVSGKLAHAWPELYFQGYGWVRFEPTPAQQTGQPPVWSDPFAGLSSGTSGPGSDPRIGRQGADPGAAANQPQQAAGGIGGAITGHGPWLPSAGGVALAALLVAAVLLVIRRRRRPVELTCERAWHHLRRLLSRRASITWSDATTPRAAVRTVQAGSPNAPGAASTVPPSRPWSVSPRRWSRSATRPGLGRRRQRTCTTGSGRCAVPWRSRSTTGLVATPVPPLFQASHEAAPTAGTTPRRCRRGPRLLIRAGLRGSGLAAPRSCEHGGDGREHEDEADHTEHRLGRGRTENQQQQTDGCTHTRQHVTKHRPSAALRQRVRQPWVVGR